MLTKRMQITVSSQGFEYGVKHFYSPIDGIAIDIIQTALNIDPVRISELFRLGSVYINNQRSSLENQLVLSGSIMRIHTKPRRYFINYDWTSLVIHDDADFVILNKPAGLPSHPSVDNMFENSLTQLEESLKKKLYISHRLDTTTEGLIVYGKKIDFVKEFNQQLQGKNIEKKYVALIQSNKTLPARLLHYMERSPRAPKKVSTIFTEGWNECELLIESQTSYEIDNYNDLQLLKINLLTGRTHQIRAQLSEHGFPLLGDQLYGSKLAWKKNPNTESQIALKSCYIDFLYQQKRHIFELAHNFN